MKWLVLAGLVLLSGCMAWVDAEEIKEGQKLCKDNGGLDNIQSTLYRCVNGAKFSR